MAIETEGEIIARRNIEALAGNDKRLVEMVYEQRGRIDKQDRTIIQLRTELDALRRTVSVIRGG